MSGLRVLVLFVLLTASFTPAFASTVNSFRHTHGLAPLKRSSAMQAMAQRHARSMAARRSMDHAGFYNDRGPRGARAENVAEGCVTESCAIGIWESSAAHRANMLLHDIRSYGIASAAGGGSRYWCLVLGR